MGVTALPKFRNGNRRTNSNPGSLDRQPGVAAAEPPYRFINGAYVSCTNRPVTVADTVRKLHQSTRGRETLIKKPSFFIVLSAKRCCTNIDFVKHYEISRTEKALSKVNGVLFLSWRFIRISQQRRSCIIHKQVVCL